MKSKQIILFGPPGVDVDAQAIALAKRWQVPAVAVDALWREAIVQKTDLGVAAQTALEADEQVPDALIMRLMRRRLEQLDMLEGWVLTGFPRTLALAQAFDELLLKFERPAAQAARIQVTTGLLINRLMADKGPDNNVTTLRRRLSEYQAAIAPVIEYYQQRSRLADINGSLSTAEVTQALFQLGYEDTGAARFLQSEADLNALLADQPVVVVDCIASWCGPCKQVTPLIERLAHEYGDRASIVKLDFDSNRAIAQRFGLKGMPSVMFFKQGELLATLTGVKSYQAYSAEITDLL